MEIFTSKKKLGFGMMRLPQRDPNDSGNIDLEETKRMVDAFLERGFTYFDTAWMYNDFKSENAVRDALMTRHPRESFTLADKLHAGFLSCRADRDRIFNKQLEKTGASFFDYYLLHDTGIDHYKAYEKLDCFRWLEDKKASGLVRHAGFSFHDNADVLDQILTEHPEMEFVQLQINYLDWDSAGIQSRKCYEVATRHGTPVIAMEPVKGGTLVNLPENVMREFLDFHPEMSVASWAIRFVASLPNVRMVLSGMSNMPQLLDNTGYMADFQPLTDAERAVIQRVLARINQSIAIPCTGCSYCAPGCPMKIAIPQYFSLYNTDLQEVAGKEWQPQAEYYDRLTQTFGRASTCIACGQCEGVCPQHLPIIEHLKTVAEYFER